MPSARILSIGISSTEACGVRDAALVLNGELRHMGVDARMLWGELRNPSGPLARQMLSDWFDAFRVELDRGDVDGVILHYSSFAFGPRGLPVHAPRVARLLHRAPIPALGFLHELAYPFGIRGWRGAIQAVSQRAALIPVVRACDAVVVTTNERAVWLRSRRWLPMRPTRFVPVFSNLPPAPPAARSVGAGTSIGVFGFSTPGIDLRMLREALRLVAETGQRVELVLVGAPGPDSAVAADWRMCSPHVESLRFTGIRALNEIARELGAIDIVLFPDRGGASSRKGTLAAALAAAKPVVAIEGPHQWAQLLAEEAVAVVPADPSALAATLSHFCADATARVKQGARAEWFYRRNMSSTSAAETIVSLLRELGVAVRAPELVVA